MFTREILNTLEDVEWCPQCGEHYLKLQTNEYCYTCTWEIAREKAENN